MHVGMNPIRNGPLGELCTHLLIWFERAEFAIPSHMSPGARVRLGESSSRPASKRWLVNSRA